MEKKSAFGLPWRRNKTSVFALSIKNNIKLHWLKILLMITSPTFNILCRSYKFRVIYQIYMTVLI